MGKEVKEEGSWNNDNNDKKEVRTKEDTLYCSIP